jgi:hypothetical protein
MSQNSEALLAKIKQQKEEVEAIQALWRSLFRNFTPPDYINCSIWLDRHDFETVVYGLKAAGVNLNKKAQALEAIEESHEPTAEEFETSKWTRTEILKYASGSMIKHQERENQ